MDGYPVIQRRLSSTLAVAAILAVALAPTAIAQIGGGAPERAEPETVSIGEDFDLSGGRDGDEGAESTGTFAAVKDASRPHPAVPEWDPPCFIRETHYIDELYRLRIWLPGQGPCLDELVCGAERVDDFFNGRLATIEPSSGQLAAYLTQVLTEAIPTNFDINAVDHATSLVGAGLGQQPEPVSLPVFNWCKRSSNDEFATTGEYAASFTWSTTIESEYDIPAVEQDLLARIEAQLAIAAPTIASAPDASLGYTWVKFPTWLWVDNAATELSASATNAQVDNIQLSIRARLANVSFEIDSDTLRCDADELIPYVDGETDPIEDLGPCHHIEPTTGPLTVDATLHYAIDVRRQQRHHRSQPWPETAWQPHPTRALVDIDVPANTYVVREILALNTNG